MIALAGAQPRTGAELLAELGGEVYTLWRTCVTAPGVTCRPVGRRYVRLDRSVEGFARLSPSILREFLTYTVVGRVGDEDAVGAAARRLAARTRVISRNKLRLAQRIVAEAFDPLVADGRVDPRSFCVLVAGDIVYDMSHDVQRRESSTDQVVAGSDLDVIVLLDDAAPPALAGLLDEALYARKWLYLRNPAFREEVDYIIKPIARLVEQSAFDTFPHQVACKVFEEARLIYGNAELHERGRSVLADAGVLDRLRELETMATEYRERRRAFLLGLPEGELPPGYEVAFYSPDERAEFEH